MSKILKRPMFRIGGSTNEGIVSMAQPRRQYANSNYEDLIAAYPESKDLIKEAAAKAALMSAFAGTGRSQSDRISDLLISGGLNLMSAKPVGNIFSTAASAFKEPTTQYLKGSETEDAFQRQLKLAGVSSAMSAKEARELQKMKLEAALAEEARKEKMLMRELAAKTDPTSYPIYDILEDFKKQGFKPRKITEVTGAGDKMKPTNKAVLSIPEGEIFYDPSNKLYKRVPFNVSSTGYVRIDQSGKEIKVEAPAKKVGFFESPGASYDPRAWNKQRFYEELEKKKNKVSME
ncbi:MAG: hypothetical protein ACO3EY_05960 [Candidatus Nanopelagicales bacterium]